MQQLDLLAALQGQAPTFAASREGGNGQITDIGQQPPSGRLPVEREAIACGRRYPVAPEAAMSRRSDPETSKAAAKHAAGTLEREKRIILFVLERAGESLTTAEMSELWHESHAPEDLRRVHFGRHTPARRMKILEFEGKVVRGPSRRCRATGNLAQEWSLKR